MQNLFGFIQNNLVLSAGTPGLVFKACNICSPFWGHFALFGRIVCVLFKQNDGKVPIAESGNGYREPVCQLSVTALNAAEQQSHLDKMANYQYCPRIQAGVYNAMPWAADEQVFLKWCLACSHQLLEGDFPCRYYQICPTRKNKESLLENMTQLFLFCFECNVWRYYYVPGYTEMNTGIALLAFSRICRAIIFVFVCWR